MPGRPPQQQEASPSLEVAKTPLPIRLSRCPSCESEKVEELGARFVGETVLRWEVDLICHNCNDSYAHYATALEYVAFQKNQEEDRKNAKKGIEEGLQILVKVCMEDLADRFEEALEADNIHPADFKPPSTYL